jgi:MYXO-CTERM domain-containing protein
VRVVSQTRRELVFDVTGAGDRVWIALGNSLTFAPMEVTLTTLAFDEASASGCRVAPSSRSRGFLLWVGLTLVAFGRRRREARGRGAR